MNSYRVVGRAEVGAEGGCVQVQPKGGGEAVDGEAVSAEGNGLVAAALPHKVHLLGVGVCHAGQEDKVVVLALGHCAVGLVCNCTKSCNCVEAYPAMFCFMPQCSSMRA